MIVKPNCPYCHTTLNFKIPVEKAEYLPATITNRLHCTTCGKRFYMQIMPLSYRTEDFEKVVSFTLENGKLRGRVGE